MEIRKRKEYRRPETGSAAIGIHGHGLCMTLPIDTDVTVGEAWGKENTIVVSSWDEETEQARHDININLQ